MVKCSCFVATSLDGFIAREDGGIDWLDAVNAGLPADEDCGFGAYMASVDALVMGRATFETVRDFTPWPYATTPVVVLSRTLREVPPTLRDRVTVSSETPAELVTRLERGGARHLYIDGGVTITRFLAAGLLDEITVTTIPRLLGRGRRLFGDGLPELRLEAVATSAYPFGLVQTTWRVVREATD